MLYLEMKTHRNNDTLQASSNPKRWAYQQYINSKTVLPLIFSKTLR